MSRARSDRGRAGTALWRLHAALVLLAATLLVAALGVWGADLGGDERPAGAAPRPADASRPPRAPTADAASPPPAHGRPQPAVVAWGGSGPQVAVVVRNDTSRLIRTARVRISLWDTDGRLVRRTRGPVRSSCCTLVGVPPGGLYGLSVLRQGGVEGIGDVRVRYLSLATRRFRPGAPRIAVDAPRLVRTPHATAVETGFSRLGAGRGSTHVVGQAILSDRRGRPVALASGRFACLTAAERGRAVSLQLPWPVPRGTRIEHVLAYPIPPGVAVHVRRPCSSDRPEAG